MIILSQELTFDPPEGILARYFRLECRDADDQSLSERILRIAFEGSYPPGSAGEKHGQYIASTTIDALINIEPFGLILDFRELDFSAGRALLDVYAAVEQLMEAGREIDAEGLEAEAPIAPFPLYSVTSDRSRNGYLRLLRERAPELLAFHYEDLNDAVRAIAEPSVTWGMCGARTPWENRMAAYRNTAAD